MKTVLNSILASLVFFAGCSKPSAEEYFSKAQQNYAQVQRQADTLKNRQLLPGLFKPVLEGYEKVIEAYPTSQIAETSMFILATIHTNYLQQPGLAIKAYRRYLEAFPEGGKAPLAMFMIGYLYNNEMHDLDSAALAYRNFLEKFPNSEMAASAKFELGTLGKSPSELVPKEVLAEKESNKQTRKVGKKASKKAK